MAKVITEGIGVFCQHYPKSVAIVTAQAQGKDNAMAAAWHTALSRNPPVYGVAISTKRFTYQLIVDSQEFGINFLPFAAAELVASIGSTSGQQIDKFHKFNIAKDKPVKTRVPILKAAYAAYECRLVDNRDYGDHRFLVGEIVTTHLLPEAFTPEEILDLSKVSPVLYLGRELYVTTARDTPRHLEREVYGK
ncbi:MAG: flavin reductase family protein [Chloroflexi bacterium]|nr:flavin reductase family protein [Chloroflexota bacterium]